MTFVIAVSPRHSGKDGIIIRNPSPGVIAPLGKWSVSDAAIYHLDI